MQDTMNTRTTTKFNQRAFVTLVVALTGAALPATGLANHVFQFEPLTVQRHAWMAVHTSLGVLFVVFAAWHIVLNRRPLLNHVKNLVGRAPVVGREVLYAAAVLIITTTIAAGHAFLVR